MACCSVVIWRLDTCSALGHTCRLTPSPARHPPPHPHPSHPLAVAVKMLGADKASDAAQHREVVRQLEKVRCVESVVLEMRGSKLNHTNHTHLYLSLSHSPKRGPTMPPLQLIVYT